jgi:hypothetical protein
MMACSAVSSGSHVARSSTKVRRKPWAAQGELMVNEHRNRIPHLWLWVLAGAVLVGVLVMVLVCVADPSLLIGSPPIGSPPTGLSVADELKARNDVRTTLVQALAGLAVAGGLLVTYRTYRQNRAEQDRTYERELYAKAVEQLGHEKAPVRLGALYSLERLAQDKPERRQVIVDVICAYLRMPFSPTAPGSKPELGAAGEQGEPSTGTEARNDGVGDTWRQERQVRNTAQRILTRHLGGDTFEDKRSTDPADPRIWSGMSLDLAGVTLVDAFGFLNGVMANANFYQTAFSGNAFFYETTFSGSAGFNGATFSSRAWFDGATFGDGAFFGGVLDSDTGAAAFHGAAQFYRATFSRRAMFDGVTFHDDARFDGAVFHGDAWFAGATFHGAARFDGATFHGAARFDGATFSGGDSSVAFEQSRVLSPEAQHVWPTGWCLGPDGDGGYTVVRADDGPDTGPKPEEPPASGTAGGA